MLPVSVDFPILIVPSVFSDVYLSCVPVAMLPVSVDCLMLPVAVDCLMLPVSVNCLMLIVPSVFSDVYYNIKTK